MSPEFQTFNNSQKSTVISFISKIGYNNISRKIYYWISLKQVLKAYNYMIISQLTVYIFYCIAWSISFNINIIF